MTLTTVLLEVLIGVLTLVPVDFIDTVLVGVDVLVLVVVVVVDVLVLFLTAVDAILVVVVGVVASHPLHVLSH